jgi:Flp pilus assembly protein TadD
LFAQGYALIELGRRDEAGAYLDRAVTVSPNNPQYLCEAAAWHAGRRELDAARNLYRECGAASRFAAAPADRARMLAAAERGQGYVLIEQGRFDEAEAVYRERLKAEPGDERAKNELRYIQQQRGKAGKQSI